MVLLSHEVARVLLRNKSWMRKQQLDRPAKGGAASERRGCFGAYLGTI